MTRGSDRFGVLFVGGQLTHFELYAPLFAAHPRCDLVAVADERDVPEERKRLNRVAAADVGLPYIPDLDDALGRDDVDIVCPTPEIERRGRVLAACARAGKHLYLDKPLAGSPEDIDLICDAVTEAGVVAQMYTYANAPWVRAARSSIDSGEIGDLVALHCDVMFAKGFPSSASPERRREALQPRYTFGDAKRELIEIGTYAISAICLAAGRRVESVSCAAATYFFDEHRRYAVEDFGAMQLRLGGGLVASAATGRIGFMGHPELGPHRMRVTGAAATRVFDAWRPRVEIAAGELDPAAAPHPRDPMGMWPSTTQHIPPKERWRSPTSNAREWMLADLDAFLDCVATRRTPDVDLAHAAHVADVVLAAYDAAATSRAVPVPERRASSPANFDETKRRGV